MGFLQLWDFKVHLPVQHILENNVLLVEGRGLGLVLSGKDCRISPVLFRLMS